MSISLRLLQSGSSPFIRCFIDQKLLHAFSVRRATSFCCAWNETIWPRYTYSWTYSISTFSTYNLLFVPYEFGLAHIHSESHILVGLLGSVLEAYRLVLQLWGRKGQYRRRSAGLLACYLRRRCPSQPIWASIA